MAQNIIPGLTTGNWIDIFQVVVTFLVGVATIITYFQITKLSSDTTKAASTLSEQSLLFNKLNNDLDRIVEYILFNIPILRTRNIQIRNIGMILLLKPQRRRKRL